MTRNYQVISADGHLEAPPDAWVKYIPEKHRERAPRLVALPEGGEGWVVEGRPLLHNGQNLSSGSFLKGESVKYRNESYWDEDGGLVAGAGGPVQRLQEQDQDGIDAEVLFPPVFATHFISGITDRDAYLATVQAYNTYLAEEFCSVAPDRLIGNGIIPITGVDDAIDELKRCQGMGLRSVTFHQFPNGGDHPSPEDDRFWEAALSSGMALSPHNGFGPRYAPQLNIAVGTAGQDFATALCSRSAYMPPMFTIAQVLASGVLDRLPEMRLYLAETNASWMPSVFWFMDDNYRMFGDWFGKPLRMPPSEYIRQHFTFSFIRDPMALKLRDHLPVENLMWGTDHPHSVTSFPHTREFLDEAFAGVPEALKRRILLENPAEHFGLDLEAPITPTPG